VRVLVVAVLGVAVLGVAGVVAPLSASAAPVAPGQDHDCVVGTPPAQGVDWGALHNPVLSYPAHGVKDQALQWSGGEWHMLFSYMTALPAPPHVRFDVAVSSSPDLVHWSSPQVIAVNAASPDIVRDPSGQFVVTYQTTSDQLEYRTSANDKLDRWSSPHALAHGLAHRMIDAALAFTGHGVILGFKAGSQTQHFEIAWASSLSDSFRLVGRPDISLYNDTVENYEFLTVDGHWGLVATSNTLDEPFIFTLAPGDPAHPATWLQWSSGRQLQIPDQPFDTGTGIPSVNFEHANSAYLCVGPAGEDYLTYAASTELTQFGGWGHARIGIARSDDLTNWQVPPE
jgi:hypothetical protein